MGSVIPSPAKVEIPLATYRVLERKIQEVRLAVFEVASRFAKAGTPAPSARPQPVSRADLLKALEEVAKAPELVHARVPTKLQPNAVTREDYNMADQRLDAFRSLVIEMATSFVTGRSPNIVLTPDAVERAWQVVWLDPATRQYVLTKNEASRGISQNV